MSNPLDTDAGSELFSSYETELKLVQADLNQKLDQIAESSGEQRKSAIRQAERALDEATELLDQMRMEKQNIPSSARSKVNTRVRNYATDVDEAKRKLRSLSDDRKALFGDRYTDDPQDEHLEQRQQLLSGTERLERSSARLQESQRIALETEDIGRNTLADLNQQRETITNARGRLLESEGYVDTSIKTLRGMARRYCPLTPSHTGFAISSQPLIQPPVLTTLQDGYESDNHDRDHHRPGPLDLRCDLQQIPLSVGCDWALFTGCLSLFFLLTTLPVCCRRHITERCMIASISSNQAICHSTGYIANNP
ncbi:V-snare-domain-containing protein [Aspergillus heteromorphus CBS 117.55]|uniref:V-snare-domain-containing protein n=1 Tax=Aspergillus heteromorphus CBS 117.55 TaxID=1448321 RepID=A0A317WRX6_9EURO|nr:V-snare-domain-containing protein [Aspergillus heteromorphus CBS 117.55]PWY87658.1 V-snare-domain-containing protein [Aspergillus heteromorphus CBS 117.55]